MDEDDYINELLKSGLKDLVWLRGELSIYFNELVTKLGNNISKYQKEYAEEMIPYFKEAAKDKIPSVRKAAKQALKYYKNKFPEIYNRK